MANKKVLKTIVCLTFLVVTFALAVPSSIYNTNLNAIPPLQENNDDIIKKEENSLICNKNELQHISYRGETYPSHYSIKDDYTLYTQNQGNSALCWSYAATSSAVISIMKSTNEYNDYSEEWIGFNVAKDENSAFGMSGYGETAFSTSVNAGFLYESDLSSDLLISGGKYLAESLIEHYKDSSNKLIGKNLKIAAVSSNQRASIKKHLMNCGGVIFGYNYGTEIHIVSENGHDVYFKAPKFTGSGHLVTLVGWDDELTYTVSGTTYTGAWLVQNSYADRLNDNFGCHYIFYEDTNIFSSFNLISYDDSDIETSEQLRYSTNIISSSADPIYNYNAGLLTFPYEKSPIETKQKNVFTNKDISLLYQYRINVGGYVKGISVFYDSEDVTNNFNVLIDNENKTISVSAKDENKIKLGTYKIKTYLSYNQEEAFYLNSIYVISGAEVGTLEIFKYNDKNYLVGMKNNTSPVVDDLIKCNGFEKFVNGYNYNENRRDVLVGVNNETGKFQFRYTLNMYHSIKSIDINGVKSTSIVNSNNFFDIEYSNLADVGDTKNFAVSLTCGETNQKWQFNIKIYRCDSNKTYYGDIFYLSKDGGSQTSIKYDLNSNNTYYLAPGTKAGYKFDGWYLDKEYKNQIPMMPSGDSVYTLTDGLTNPESNSSDCYLHAYHNAVAKTIRFHFLYAKFEIDKSGIVLNGSKICEASKDILYSIDFDLSSLACFNVKYSFCVDGKNTLSSISNTISLKFNDVGVHTIKPFIYMFCNGQDMTLEGKEEQITVIEPQHTQYKLDIKTNGCQIEGAKASYFKGDNIELTFIPNDNYDDVPTIELLDSSNNTLEFSYNRSNRIISFIINCNCKLSVTAKKSSSQKETSESKEDTVDNNPIFIRIFLISALCILSLTSVVAPIVIIKRKKL